MGSVKLSSSFVSQKISQVKWVPEKYSDPTCFITGSWDDRQNSLKYWKLSLPPTEFPTVDEEVIPKCLTKVPVEGDVTGLEFIDNDKIGVSTSNGSVFIYDVSRELESRNITVNTIFEEAHKYSNGVVAPCTALSCFETDIATVGEDGRLNIFSTVKGILSRAVENADSVALTCVSYVQHMEVLVGNRNGTVKMFDVRTDSQKPTNVMPISCEDDKKSNAVTCLTYHPTQKHIVLGGSEEGSITVWDLRHANYPVSFLKAHDSEITHISFHRTQPTKLFSTSCGGDLWQWSQQSNRILPTSLNAKGMTDSDRGNPWLNGERTRNCMNITSLLAGTKSLNSFDTVGNKLVCGCDNEALYIIENLSQSD